METREVANIYVYIKGAWRLLRDSGFYVGGAWQIFKVGSGIFFRDVWYVLKALLSQIERFNQYRKDNPGIVGGFPVVNKICFTDPEDTYAKSFFYYDSNRCILYITTNDKVKSVSNVYLYFDNLSKMQRDMEIPTIPNLDIDISESDKLVVVKVDGHYVLLKYSAEYMRMRAVDFIGEWAVRFRYDYEIPLTGTDEMFQGDFTVKDNMVYVVYMHGENMNVSGINFNSLTEQMELNNFKLGKCSPKYFARNGFFMWDEEVNRGKTIGSSDFIVFICHQVSQDSQVRKYEIERLKANMLLTAMLLLKESPSEYVADCHMPICYGRSGFFLLNRKSSEIWQYNAIASGNGFEVIKKIAVQNADSYHFAQDLSSEDVHEVWLDVDNVFLKLE